jgi:hypothetical protein
MCTAQGCPSSSRSWSAPSSILQSKPTLPFRFVLLAFGALQAAVWLLIVGNGLFSGSDQATKGLDRDFAILVSAVFLPTVVPAIALAFRAQWLPLATALMLAPVAGLVAFMAWFTMS